MSLLEVYEVRLLAVLPPDWLLAAIEVDLHVDVSGAFLLVALPTHPAAVRFLSAVRQEVFLEVVLGDKGFPAQAAAKWPLLPMEADVGLQVSFGAEALAAEAAAERFLPGVSQHVGFQPSDLPEGFPTDATQEWFLARVDPLVDLQDVDRGQALPTGLTGDPAGRFVSRVVLDVGHQSAVIYECLPAEFADIRSLSAVDPLMTPQSTGPWEGLTTYVAAVWFHASVPPHVGLYVLVAFTTDVTDFPGVSVGQQVVGECL